MPKWLPACIVSDIPVPSVVSDVAMRLFPFVPAAELGVSSIKFRLLLLSSVRLVMVSVAGAPSVPGCIVPALLTAALMVPEPLSVAPV